MSDRELQNLVRSLPEESPSLAWRSQLNEKLRAEAARPARRFGFSRSPFGRGLLGFGAVGAVAAALVGAVLLSSPVPTVGPAPVPAIVVRAVPAVEVPTSSVADLLALHDEGAAIADVSGAGVDARESDLTERELRFVLVQGML